MSEYVIYTLLVETIPTRLYWLTCRKQKFVQSKALKERLFVLILGFWHSRQCPLLNVHFNDMEINNITVRVLLKLFDRMILQICKYNCEVWGSTFLTRKFLPSDFLSAWQLKNTVDKLYYVFIEQILSANTKASNCADTNWN